MSKEILGSLYVGASNNFGCGYMHKMCKTIKARGDIGIVEMEVKVIGQLEGGYDMANRVYDKNGLSPTIRTFQGGGLEPKIIDKQIVAMRGRNPDNPSDRTAGNPTEQRLEPNSQGICNTLTSVQKDNLVMESIINPLKGKTEYGWHFEQNVYSEDSNVIRSIKSSEGSGNIPKVIENKYRIRKLTPLECWRLMGFNDVDFSKAAAVNSNSQLYKQAGNSIVKNVLMAIFKQMLLEGEKNNE